MLDACPIKQFSQAGLCATTNNTGQPCFPRVFEGSRMNTELNFDQLIQLSNANYEGFSDSRRMLIARFLGTPGRKINELQSLQNEIDLIRACQCSPSRTIDGIAALIAPRVQALQKITEELLSLQSDSARVPSPINTKGPETDME